MNVSNHETLNDVSKNEYKTGGLLIIAVTN